MKVLQIFPSPIRGGAEEQALTVGKGIAKRGHEVHAAFPVTEGTATLVHDYKAGGMSCHHLDIPAGEKGLKNTLRHCATTLALLERLHPEAVHLGLPYPNQGLGSMLACALFKIPTVCVFHLVNDEICMGAVRRKLYAWMRKKTPEMGRSFRK